MAAQSSAGVAQAPCSSNAIWSSDGLSDNTSRLPAGPAGSPPPGIVPGPRAAAAGAPLPAAGGALPPGIGSGGRGSRSARTQADARPVCCAAPHAACRQPPRARNRRSQRAVGSRHARRWAVEVVVLGEGRGNASPAPSGFSPLCAPPPGSEPVCGPPSGIRPARRRGGTASRHAVRATSARDQTPGSSSASRARRLRATRPSCARLAAAPEDGTEVRGGAAAAAPPPPQPSPRPPPLASSHWPPPKCEEQLAPHSPVLPPLPWRASPHPVPPPATRIPPRGHVGSARSHACSARVKSSWAACAGATCSSKPASKRSTPSSTADHFTVEARPTACTPIPSSNPNPTCSSGLPTPTPVPKPPSCCVSASVPPSARAVRSIVAKADGTMSQSSHSERSDAEKTDNRSQASATAAAQPACSAGTLGCSSAPAECGATGTAMGAVVTAGGAGVAALHSPAGSGTACGGASVTPGTHGAPPPHGTHGAPPPPGTQGATPGRPRIVARMAGSWWRGGSRSASRSHSSPSLHSPSSPLSPYLARLTPSQSPPPELPPDSLPHCNTSPTHARRSGAIPGRTPSSGPGKPSCSGIRTPSCSETRKPSCSEPG
eukprot:scaffold113_cov96-Isochrysis_galbana.AAC.2